MRKTLIAASLIAMACAGSKQDLVCENFGLAQHLNEPSVLVGKLYDPVAGAECARGAEREALERAGDLDAVFAFIWSPHPVAAQLRTAAYVQSLKTRNG